jgi:segregation and condensation protein A
MMTVTASMSGVGYPEGEPEVAGDGSLQRPYTVHLPGFDGPLELLLHLIERNQLEITTISLVAVTDQFIAYLKTWDEPPLPRLAEFVAMAARLLLIKSRSLLPHANRQDDADDEPDPLEDAENLRRHLIEYKIAKEIARALKARDLAGLQTFARPGRLVDAEAMVVLSPPQLVGLNVQALALVFRRVVAEKRLSEPEQIPLPVVTIAQKIAEVEGWLREHARATLEDVLRSANSRFAVVVTFLAVLELWHQSRLIVRQEALFGEIEIVPGPRFGQRIETTSVGGEALAGVDVPQVPSELEPEADPADPAARRQRRMRTSDVSASSAE